MINHSNENKESLIVKSEWFPGWKMGFLQIVGQKNKRELFFKGSNTFHASNGVILCSEYAPEWRYANYFYVRGSDSDQDNNIITVHDEDEFWRFLDAVEEYNKSVAIEVKINYFELHQKLWMLLAETGSRDKNQYVEKVMEMYGLTECPESHCFLCEETKVEAKSTLMKCSLCKGYWGRDVLGCLSKGSYYMMWREESDINLRKALAKRIAKNVIVTGDIKSEGIVAWKSYM